MKILNTKIYLLIGTLLCTATLFAQTQTSQTPPVPKDPRISWPTRRDLKPGETLPPFNPQLKSTLVTKANASDGAIVDGMDVRVFPSPNPQSEVHISINHKDPNNLIASANTGLGLYGGKFFYNQGYYYSWDGGYTWSGADFLQTAPRNYVLGDPSTGIAANGTVIITSIGFDVNQFSYTYWFQKSRNGGNTWSNAKSGINYQTFGFDKDMMGVDNDPHSPYANNFYMSYTDFSFGGGEVIFNRSTDLGQTFSSPIIIRNQVAGFGQGTNVQTGPNGEVYVCWADHDSVVFPYRADALGFARSMDGGANFSSSKRVFNYSGTRTFGTDPTYNYVRVSDFPAMAVDKSNGWHRGRIYVTYPALKNDTGKSIIEVRWSDDKGDTWSNPVKVNIPRGRENFFPWIATDDATGDVWVVYYSFDTPTQYETNTYVALSTDGGATWQNQKVSDVSHITQPVDNNYFAYGYAGDYIGITAYGRKAYPAWMDERNGTWQIYVSPVSKSSMTAAQPTLQSNLTVGPNPFNSNLSVNLAKGTVGKIELVNQSGVTLKLWQNAKTTTLNVSDVPRGSYLLKVTGTDNKVYTQKIIKE